MPDLFDTADPPTGYARVAVERGVDRYPDGLTYAIPGTLSDLAEGERVIVPLGRGSTPTPGYIVEVVTEPGLDPDRIKPIERRDESGTRLPPGLLRLARWISGYYCAPIGMTLAAMLPAAVKHGVGRRAHAMIDLGRDPEPDTRLSPQRRAVLDLLHALPASERPIEIRVLAERAGLRTTGPIKAMLEDGYVVRSWRSTIEAKWISRATDTTVPDRLTDEQAAVINAVVPTLGSGFAVHLLFGVTGGGKTEVFIRLLEHVVAQGRVGLILVPEISLTPQTGGRLIGRFPEARVAILHSALTAAQRHQQWAMIARGEADLVIGARSAVFAPIPDGRLGFVVVDEEHDGSYKQDQVPRYHGRDVAIRRAQIASCPILLSSATPALESWHNARIGRYTLHRVTRRAPGLTLPDVRVVDLAEERRNGMGNRLIGPCLGEAMSRTLADDGQILLLLNRRGYASYLVCTDSHCGWIQNCDHCDVTVVYHKHRGGTRGGFVRCHHCLTEQLLAETCPQCGHRVMRLGLGTQRLEEELASSFPQLDPERDIVRMDSDTMRRGADYHEMLERFRTGEIRVLAGTQMIAKGLDFPNARLVGVINADTGLNMPDFRATERTFQLVAQVAGRAGRGMGRGRVIVQTFHPNAEPISLAARHDYETFARQELQTRREMAYPPTTRLTRIVVRDEDHDRGRAASHDLAAALTALATPPVRVDQALPCPIARIAGRHRFEIQIHAPTAAGMQSFMTAARRAALIRSGVAMAIDVDPIALL